MTTTQPKPTSHRRDRWHRPFGERVEDDRFVQGQGNYLDDHTLPGMLHMAILRSPVAHVRINRIDTSAAAAVDGVVAVVTGELLAGYGLARMPTMSGRHRRCWPPTRSGSRARRSWWSPPIRTSWKDALELIDVDYDILPAVTTPQQALADGTVVIS